MVITLEPNASETVIQNVLNLVARYPGIVPKKHVFKGEGHTVVEIHLVGQTSQVPTEPFEASVGVRRVVRVSTKYRVIGRHGDGKSDALEGFTYNGLKFSTNTVHIFAGLCAVDNRQNVETMMRALSDNGIQTTRMGAYKPRTSPYEFQGLGASCLPWVFELAGKYDVKCVAMEVTDGRQIEEVRTALEQAGKPTGVMLQIGTRNTQNFELLKQVGAQADFPVLFKRGMGITLEESLNACEYVASEGNPNVIFCLRGVKTHLADPHRNLVDFAHVPVVRRQTRLLVCVDPSHSVGRMATAPDGLTDIFHVVGQGIIAGANMVLIDFHPNPGEALCDGPQALTLDQLPKLQKYVERVRTAYEECKKIAAA